MLPILSSQQISLKKGAGNTGVSGSGSPSASMNDVQSLAAEVARIAKRDDEWHASDQGGDSSWRVHTSSQWFMSAQERLFFHVPTQTAFIETAEGSGVFMPLGGSGDGGADATDQSLEDQQAAPAEEAAADAEYEEPSGEGEGEGEGVGEDENENEMDEEVGEMEMDLAKEVRAHAAQIPVRSHTHTACLLSSMCVVCVCGGCSG